MTEIQCRICLQTKDVVHTLDEKIEDRFVWQAINNIANVFVSVGDPFPQNVCLICFKKLRESIQFRTEIECSDQILHSNDIECITVIKTEPVDEEEFKTDFNDSSAVYEPDVVIKSKRGRVIKQKVNFYEDEDEIDIDRKPKKEEMGSNSEMSEFEDESSGSEEVGTQNDISNQTPNQPKTKRRSRKKAVEHRCCMCQILFKDETELLAHVDSGVHAEQIEANLGRKFITRQIHECKYCNLKFRSRTFLRMHFEVPNFKEPPRNRTYKPKPKVRENLCCTYCGKILANLYELRLHEMRIHPNDLSIECPHPGCGKKFGAQIVMRKHMRIHLEKKHICDICGKAFGAPKELYRHGFVHKDIKPLQCSLCPKSFIHKISLKQHMETHSSENVGYPCDQCEKTYKWKEDLQKHIRGFHLGDHPYKCKHCGKGYYCSSSRKYHQDRCQIGSIRETI